MARAKFRSFGYRGFLVGPCGLAYSRAERRAAAICAAATVAVFLFELATPDDVVAALALMPLMAALWAMSNRYALVISALTLALFGIVFGVESHNRPTLLYIAAAGILLGGVLRLYAINLAAILAARLHHPAPAPHLTRTLGSLETAVRTGLDALTRRELEVARLAAQGYMASEIAARLHISERTVESHLAHAYAKLGVNSRPALIRIGAQLAGDAQPSG
jgi:DNA-binding CsgD family transcriptional regulator